MHKYFFRIKIYVLTNTRIPFFTNHTQQSLRDDINGVDYRRKNYTVQDATAILLLHHGHAIIIIIIVIVSETVASSTTFLRSYSCLKEKPILNGPLIINHLLVVESLMEMIHSTHERLNTINAKGPPISSLFSYFISKLGLQRCT